MNQKIIKISGDKILINTYNMLEQMKKQIINLEEELIKSQEATFCKSCDPSITTNPVHRS